jgi:hypothetical protein
MKFISTLLLTSFLYLSVAGQGWKLTGNYSFGLPQQQMGKNIQPAHSLQTGILYQLCGNLSQLSVGFGLGIGSYANKRIDQTFQFDNNTASVVPVNYSSNTFNVNFQTRFDLLKGNYLVTPYINAKGGLYNFFSTIYIDDPNDAGGCHALEQKTLMNDNTMYWSAGGGLQIDPKIFMKGCSCQKKNSDNKKAKSNLQIDLGANVIHGGTMSYINTKHLVDAQTVTDPAGKPLQVQFINASSQQIHEHTVAQVYTSTLRMIEFTLGITLQLGNN